MANNARLLVRFADALAMQTAVAFRSPIVVPAGIHRTCGGLARPSLPEKSARSDDLQSGIGPWLPSPAEDGRISPWVSFVRTLRSIEHLRSSTIVKRYNYIGPDHIRRAAEAKPPGSPVRKVEDLGRWLRESRQAPDPSGQVIATFVVATDGTLWLADRRSEHVACAAGGQVLSAGEITFDCVNGLQVVSVTNQSTGYCPEPESWPLVAAALDRIGLAHPDRFTLECVFRVCPSCGERNLVKEGWFVCEICGHELPNNWNCDPAQANTPQPQSGSPLDGAGRGKRVN